MELQQFSSPPYPILTDIAGTSPIKQSLEEIVTNIQHAGVFRMLGVEPEKSYLFEGPPGTGKTFAVNALANELGHRDLNVSLRTYNIGTHGTAYINMGARILQQFFDEGREESSNGTIVLYWFDEADVLMGHRGQRESSKEDDKLLNCLMKNLQDINSSTVDEYLFFATNFKSAMDSAAIRSGRIDRIVRFEMPTYGDLLDAYHKEVGKVNRHFNQTFPNPKQHIINDIAYDILAQESVGFTYPDVTEIVRRSIRGIGHHVLTTQDKIAKIPALSTKSLVDEIHKLRTERYPVQTSSVGFQ